jgi:intein/homing endonuclease
LEWRRIQEVIKHPRRTEIYKIKTQNGYEIETTSCHSVYVWEEGQSVLKEAGKIKIGDVLIFPLRLPRTDQEIAIDLTGALVENRRNKEIFVRLRKGLVEEVPAQANIDLGLSAWRKFQNRRESIGISRYKMAEAAGVYKTAIQQWESKSDNVMPKFGQLKPYLEAMGESLDNEDYSIYLPIRDWHQEGRDNGIRFFLDNHTREIKVKFNLDEKLAYFLGWYLGDGCASFITGSPNRFIICLGKDKERKYFNALSLLAKELFGVRVVVDRRPDGSINMHFHSFSFNLLLEYFGLLGKKAHEKFIPEEFFNAKEPVQKALLRGLIESDGYIVVGRSKDKHYGDRKVVGYSTVSKRLAQGVIYLLRQLGAFPAISRQWPKPHIRKGKLFKSNYQKMDVAISTKEQISALRDIWQGHKDAFKLKEWMVSSQKKGNWGKHLISISKDCAGLKVIAINKQNCQDKYVYDLSVVGNQNFVAGEGGVVCHNTDGSHIRTLLLTLLYRQMPKLVESGYVYIAQPPLYKIKRGQREEYIQTEQQMDDLLLDLGREGHKLLRVKDKQTFTDNQFKELLRLLVELDKLGRYLNKKGVDFADYLNYRHPKTKKMPVYRVKVEGKDHFVFSDKELAALTEKESKEAEQDVLQLFEAQEIEEVIAKIEKLGFEIGSYFSSIIVPKSGAAKDGDKKLKAVYRITNDGDTKEVFSLKEVLTYIKEAATKGMHIQRYKGLGEMNPHQLWDTTMDPEKRTILQVKLEDAVEADKMFTVLMGDQVEPRRQFIEDYAHQVKNLDI